MVIAAEQDAVAAQPPVVTEKIEIDVSGKYRIRVACGFDGQALRRVLDAWLFAGSDRGGQRAAATYSIIVTAKMTALGQHAQAMRAILLASATATTLNGLRARSCVSQGYFSGLWRAYRNTAQAPTTRMRRK